MLIIYRDIKYFIAFTEVHANDVNNLLSYSYLILVVSILINYIQLSQSLII